MIVSPNIYLSRPGDVDFDTEYLDAALKDVAAKANRVEILSAYHGPTYIISLLRSVPRPQRRGCSITLVFGVDNNSELMQAREGLRALANNLSKLGFKDLILKIHRKEKPFHTKLYYFKCGTQPVWFIGSANASAAVQGARHEMMIRLRGRHDALRMYVNSIIETAIDVKNVEIIHSIVDLQSFFLSGSLCYKPIGRLQFSFESCDINADHRRLLRQNISDASKIRHADPQTEGFGFNLVNAAKVLSGEDVGDFDLPSIGEDAFDAPATPHDKSKRIRFRHLSIETIYGYWLPRPFADMLREKAHNEKAKQLDELLKFADILNQISDESLLNELDLHIEETIEYFREIDPPVTPKNLYRHKFLTFLSTRRKWLQDEEKLERMSRRLHIEKMPDIWNDINVARSFEESFFEDFLLRLDGTGRTSEIIERLRRAISSNEAVGAQNVRLLLEKRLEKGFSDEVWKI